MIEVIETIISPDSSQILFRVCSNDSNPKKWEDYHISLDDEVYLCTCPDFQFNSGFPEYFENHQKGKQQPEQYKCKHILAVEEYLAKEAEIAERGKELYYEKKHGVIS